MVLKLSFPKHTLSIRWIEKYFSKYYRIRKLPLDKFLSIEEAIAASTLSKPAFWRLLTSSPKFYGICINGVFYVHPDGVVAHTKKLFQKRITLTLTNQVPS